MVLEISRFFDFQYGGRPLSDWEGQFAPLYQNCIIITQTVVEISRLTDFFKLDFLKSHKCLGTICVTMQNFVKIGQTVCGALRLFYFQGGSHFPSWIFKFSHLWKLVVLVGYMCITIPNLNKIDPVVAEIGLQHLTIFKKVVVRHFGFFFNLNVSTTHGPDAQSVSHAKCKVPFKSVKRLLRYSIFVFFLQYGSHPLSCICESFQNNAQRVHGGFYQHSVCRAS